MIMAPGFGPLLWWMDWTAERHLIEVAIHAEAKRN